MKKVKNISLILLVLALLIIGSSSIVVTNENEYSLIRQFGKVDHVVSSAGVTFKIPFVQSVDKLPKEILLYDLSSSDVITSDKKTMICDSYILWQINDPLKFAQTLNSSISNAESRLDTIVYNSTKNIISSTTQNDVISGRDGELAAAIMKNIGNTTEQYGIELLSFETKQLDLPSDNKAAVYERMISERENISATYTAACAYRCKSSCSCPASFSAVSLKRCVACSRIPSLTYPCRQNPPILSRHRIPAKRVQKKPRIIITPKRVPYYYDYYEADSLSYSIICLM